MRSEQRKAQITDSSASHLAPFFDSQLTAAARVVVQDRAQGGTLKSLILCVSILLFFCALPAHAQIVYKTGYTDSVATSPTFQFNANTAPGDAIVVWGYSNPNVSDFSGVPTDTDVNAFTQSISAKTAGNDVHGVVW